MPNILHYKDLPRTTTRQEYRVLSKWIRQTSRIIEAEIPRMMHDLMVYGTVKVKWMEV